MYIIMIVREVVRYTPSATGIPCRYLQLLDKEMLELYPKTKELKKLMTLIGRDELSFEVGYCAHISTCTRDIQIGEVVVCVAKNLYCGTEVS